MKKLIIAAALALCTAGSTQAATYTVPTDFPTIQAAIDGAASGDVIQVERGVYYENLTFSPKNITLRGLGGAAQTVIDGNKVAPVMKFVNLSFGLGMDVLSPVIEGFTIQNGLGLSGWGADGAGGVNVYGSFHPTFNGCILTNNVGVTGGAVSANSVNLTQGYASAIFNDCTITNNTATQGGAAHAYLCASVWFNRSNVTGNVAQQGGAFYAYYFGVVRAVASHVTGNGADYGGAGYASGSSSGVIVESSVVDLNTATVAGGAFYADNQGQLGGFHPTITRNTAPVGGSVYDAGNRVQFSRAIIWGNSTLPVLTAVETYGYTNLIEGAAALGLTNAVDVDPLFVNAASRNYRLQAGSPAIDAVNGGYADADVVGTPRPQGLGWDYGAYEYRETTAPAAVATFSGTVGNGGVYVSAVTATVTATDNSQVQEIHYLVDGVETVVAGATASVTVSADGAHTFRAWAVDIYGNKGNEASNTFTIDRTAPAVSSISPANAATNVSTSASVVVTFSETVTAGAAYGSVTLKRGSTTVTVTKTLSGNKLTLKPSSSMSAATTYTVTLPAGAVRDAAGNASAAFTSTFRTR